jgi:DNA polymerase
MASMSKDGNVEVSALPFLPPRPTLKSMSEAAQGCQGCPLYRHATQAVFGEGRRAARVILVGEQPGNDEDLKGRPFVGPAGKILDEALEAAGIARDDAYVTNVVKHFKWEPRGKKRIHKKPNAREIAACLPWLEKEIELIRPQVLVCLGATAAQSLLGRDFRVSTQRGRDVSSRLAPHVVATVHPSSILRQRTREDRHREMERFIADLRVAATLLAGPAAGSSPRHRARTSTSRVRVTQR